MSEPASNPMSPQLERIAREKAKKGWLLLADAVTAEEEEETFYKVILSALALQVEKEKKSLGSETPPPLGQQPEEAKGYPFGGIICAACPLDVGACPLCGTYWVRYEDKRIGYRRN
jgi:hypothetical protein